MSIIVSDTSPIRALAHLDLLELLRQLFGSVIVPPAVAEELRSPGWATPGIEVGSIPWVSVRAPQDSRKVEALLAQLDLGEAEAIALALEVRPEALLIDEAEGRSMARRFGLRPLGALGVLVQARERGLLAAVVPLVDRLRSELRFFVSSQLRDEVRRQAGE